MQLSIPMNKTGLSINPGVVFPFLNREKDVPIAYADDDYLDAGITQPRRKLRREGSLDSIVKPQL